MEKELQKMADHHRKQSGFTDKDQAPPSIEAYNEKKYQYDKLAERVNSTSKYDALRKKERSKKIVDKKKPIIEMAKGRGLGMRAYGWSRDYSDKFDKIFK